jgi:hypothetical protein
MHPLVKGAVAVAVLTALGRLAGAERAAAPPPPEEHAKGVDGMPALCGPGTLPEGPVCVRIPKDVAAALPPAPPEPEPPAAAPSASASAPEPTASAPTHPAALRAP